MFTSLIKNNVTLPFLNYDIAMANIKERKLWLDSLRGVAMILVVYGHLVPKWTDYFVFTSPVKMPLFFAISGYLFNPRGGNQLEFLKTIFLRLIIPWLVLGMFPFSRPLDRFLGLLSGEILWFMPCLVISEIVWFYVLKFCNNDVWVIVSGLLVSMCGVILSLCYPIRYAMIDTAFVVQAYFVLGFLIRKYEDLLSLKWPYKTLFFIIIYFSLSQLVLAIYPGESLDVHLNKYFNYPICALMIICGCTTLFVLFRKFNITPKWLVYIGQNTLAIYILHGYGIILYRIITGRIGLDIVLPLPIQALIKTVFSCLVCCILAYVLNQYLPELVGKKRKKI